MALKTELHATEPSALLLEPMHALGRHFRFQRFHCITVAVAACSIVKSALCRFCDLPVMDFAAALSARVTVSARMFGLEADIRKR